MASLFRLGFQHLVKKIPSITAQRGISVTSVNLIKEIRVTKNDKEIIVEGVYVESPHEKFLVKPVIEPAEEGKNPICYLCALDLNVKHTDVLILRQFVRSDGCFLPRRITRLCAMQQKRMKTLVTMAQKAGLMINVTPAACKKDPRKRQDYKKFNTYYDEDTIFAPKEPKQRDRFKR